MNNIIIRKWLDSMIYVELNNVESKFVILIIIKSILVNYIAM